MTATPTIAISAASSSALIGSSQIVNVTFSNTADPAGANATGYAPFVVLSLDSLGATDSLGHSNLQTGAVFAGATFLGTAVDSVVATFDASGGYTIAKSNDGTGHPIVLHGIAGNQIVLLTLPFGSFTAGQTPVDIQVSLTINADAKVGAALPVSVQGGFLYGTSALGDTNANPTIITSAATISFDPAVFTVSSSYSGPESEIAAGPSNAQSWKVLGTLANGATISELTLIDKLPNGAVPTQVTLDDGNGHLYVYAVDTVAGTLTAITAGAPPIVSSASGAGPWVYFNAAANTIEADFGAVTGSAAAGPSISTTFFVATTQSLGSASQASTAAGADFQVVDMLPYGAVANTFTITSDNGAFVYKYDASQAPNATHGVSLVSQGSGTTAPTILTGPGAVGFNWVYYDAANGKIVSNFDGIAPGHVGAIDAEWSGGAYQQPGTISQNFGSAASNSLMVDQLNGGTTTSSFTLTNGGLSYVYDVGAGGAISFDAAKSSVGAHDIGVGNSAASVSSMAGVYYDAANYRIYANFGPVAGGTSASIAANFSGAETVNTASGSSFSQANNVSGTGSYHSHAYGSASVAVVPAATPGVASNIPGEDIVTAKAIALQKSVVVADSLAPGGHLTWTLNGEVSNYADITNIVVTDTLGDGQHFDRGLSDTLVPRLVAVSNGATVYDDAINPADYSFVRDPITGLTTIKFNISDQLTAALKNADLNGGAAPNDEPAVAAPASFKIVFTSVIDDAYVALIPVTASNPTPDQKVEQGDTVGNTVSVSGNLVNASASVVSDGSQASVTIPTGDVVKSIYQVNGKAMRPASTSRRVTTLPTA